MAAAEFYVVDTNVYIEAYRRYYAFDLVETFWTHLEENGKTGRVVSIDRVKGELQDKDDDLCRWACEKCNGAFISTDRPDVIHYFGKIMQWVQAQNFKPAAKTEFASGADGWVIAYAKAAGHNVVTEETYEPDRKNKVKIPNVCKQFGVPYMNTFDLLRKLGVKFS